MKTSTKIGFCFLFLGILSACEKDNEFPVEPVLEVRSFEKTDEDNAVWKIGFTDGDGDIGVRDELDQDNFIVTIFAVFQDSLIERSGTSYRIPIVQNIRTTKGIEGEFEFRIQTQFFRLDSLLDTIPYDSLMYTGYAIDRSGNRSNNVSTPAFPF